ncbi:putative holin [Lactococcus phage bIL170]|uniref:Putative holin n=2 Tax=Skunavirus bIL170 TaxID=63118 RepID=O80121_9CAUD|nr:putative holin [Lactococcus phage bIL170]AAC27200.1 putative holin [Lactococcus phage bIL170]AAR26446.1 putative holin [Lactococcus phage bIL170]
MVTRMILITILILAILFATWVKDREAMNPPFKRRLVIDLTVVFALWVLYAVFYFTQTPSTSDIAKTVINIGLLYFVGQFIYLIASISPMFAGLIKIIKKNGVNIPDVENEQTEDKKE